MAKKINKINITQQDGFIKISRNEEYEQGYDLNKVVERIKDDKMSAIGLANWIAEMTKKQVDCPDYYKPERVLPKLSAGYHTWISRDNILFRDGSAGQYIICDYKNNRLITIMSTQKDMSLVTECLRDLI